MRKPLTEEQFCRRLLQKRDQRPSVWFYFRGYWKLRVLVLLVALAYAGWVWKGAGSAGPTVSVGVLAFLAGLWLRDFQWARALVKDWSRSFEYIDWEKIERVAASGAEDLADSTGLGVGANRVESSDDL